MSGLMSLAIRLSQGVRNSIGDLLCTFLHQIQKAWKWITAKSPDEERRFDHGFGSLSAICAVLTIALASAGVWLTVWATKATMFSNEIIFVQTCYPDNINRRTQKWCENNATRVFRSGAPAPHWPGWQMYLSIAWITWLAPDNEFMTMCALVLVLCVFITFPRVLGHWSAAQGKLWQWLLRRARAPVTYASSAFMAIISIPGADAASSANDMDEPALGIQRQWSDWKQCISSTFSTFSIEQASACTAIVILGIVIVTLCWKVSQGASLRVKLSPKSR